MKSIVITQSNYIPWKGFFDAMKIADEFVLYDDMQYTRRDWRNRNKIKTPQGPLWLTIPVVAKGKYLQKINETLLDNRNWADKHLRSIFLNYKKAPCFGEVKDFIEHLYRGITSMNLSEVNFWFLREISKWMEIDTRISFSSEYMLEHGKTERLVGICKQLGATDYYTGPAAKDYLLEDIFLKAGINVHCFEYSGYTEYPQLYPPFDHRVSIIDLLMNTGKDFRRYMKHF